MNDTTSARKRRRPSRTALLAATPLFLVALSGLAGCGEQDGAAEAPVSTTGAETSPPVAMPPGAKAGDSPMVLEAFRSVSIETDCAALQGRFDAADEGHGRADGQGDLGRAEEFTRLMAAVDDRMRDIDCY